MDDMLWRLQQRIFGLEDTIRELQRETAAEGRGRWMIGAVINQGAKPTTVPAYYAVHPVVFGGAETEGAMATTSTGSAVEYVLCIGPGVPAVGDYLICHAVGSRWVAKRKTAGTPTGWIGTLGCSCTSSPVKINQTVSCTTITIDPCTYVYGPTPSIFVSSLGTNSYLSNTTFIDTDTGDAYYWYLGCSGSTWRISRVFPTSPYGSPYIDSVAYSWSVGLTGNTCGDGVNVTAFQLHNGQPYYGPDPTCVVNLDGTT